MGGRLSNSDAAHSHQEVVKFKNSIDRSSYVIDGKFFDVSISSPDNDTTAEYYIMIQPNSQYSTQEVTINRLNFAVLGLERDYFSTAFNVMKYDEVEGKLDIFPTDDITISIHR